jgi:hypothetical protein
MKAFSDADLDRLADFVGGALEGTPEADDVRHLVSTDTQWAEAYASLVTAEAAVRDELRALGTEALAVPPEVQRRLDVALTAAISAPPADAAIVDLARAREARRRRRGRWAVGLAAAAAVLVCGGIGVQVLKQGVQQSSKDSATSGDVAAPQAVPGEGGGSTFASSAGGGASEIVMTGRDYSPETLGQLAGVPPSSAPNALSEGSGTDAGKRADLSSDVPSPLSPLRRLGEPAARAACLNAITREYGGQVTLVDFARFEGQPVLVTVIDGTRAGGGRRLVVVVGPDCGLGGAIADERYRGTL